MMSRYVPAGTPKASNGPRISPREMQVLNHVADGKNTCQIATVMNLKKRTVTNYMRTLFILTGATSRAELAEIGRNMRCAKEAAQ